LPANWEKQKERLDFEEEKEKKRKEIEEKGLEYERVRALEWTAEECDAWERKRLKKHNPGSISKTILKIFEVLIIICLKYNKDTGFADFEQSSYRQYERLTKNLAPDMENYEKQKKQL
jgi:pre-mRNA-splicing factor SYF2